MSPLTASSVSSCVVRSRIAIVASRAMSQVNVCVRNVRFDAVSAARAIASAPAVMSVLRGILSRRPSWSLRKMSPALPGAP